MEDVVISAFCSIQRNFIRSICAKFGIPNSPQSPDIGQNSDMGISNLWILDQYIINENFHNCRTSNAIRMKLKPVTKLDKRNTTTLTMTNYWEIVTSLSFFQFMANLEQDSKSIILTFFKIVTFELTKSKNRAKNISNTAFIPLI